MNPGGFNLIDKLGAQTRRAHSSYHLVVFIAELFKREYVGHGNEADVEGQADPQ